MAETKDPFGKCQECGTLTLDLKGSGIPPTYCIECRMLLNDNDGVAHPKRVRCPVCKHIQDADPDGEWDKEDESTSEVTCRVCGVEYDVICSVTINWKSPAVTGREPELESLEGRENV